MPASCPWVIWHPFWVVGIWKKKKSKNVPASVSKCCVKRNRHLVWQKRVAVNRYVTHFCKRAVMKFSPWTGLIFYLECIAPYGLDRLWVSTVCWRKLFSFCCICATWFQKRPHVTAILEESRFRSLQCRFFKKVGQSWFFLIFYFFLKTTLNNGFFSLLIHLFLSPPSSYS